MRGMPKMVSFRNHEKKKGISRYRDFVDVSKYSNIEEKATFYLYFSILESVDRTPFKIYQHVIWAITEIIHLVK